MLLLNSLPFPEDYTHTIQAFGGFWSASFSIAGGQAEIDDWMESGLGRHIVTYDDALGVAWEGFVNAFTASYGPLEIKRGPLLQIGNETNLIYSTMDTSVTPPTVGLRAATGWADDTTSQADYGILQRVLSTGGTTAADAAQIRNMWLAENAQPLNSHNWTSGKGSTPRVKVECLGYVHWLNYVYNQTAVSGTGNASTKVAAILNATNNPNNSWLPYDVAHIATNALQVPLWENDNRIALDILKEIAARGDGSLNRWLFGVYEDRKAYYQAAPATVEYYHSLSDPAQRITTPPGQPVYYWNVRPGKWLLFNDFLVGHSAPANMRDDPRYMFIESVTYSAPWGLRLRGGRAETLAQLLAQKGLSGIGA
jgi:hypothetical protein